MLSDTCRDNACWEWSKTNHYGALKRYNSQVREQDRLRRKNGGGEKEKQWSKSSRRKKRWRKRRRGGKCRLAFDHRDWDARRKDTGEKTGDRIDG